MAVQFPSSPVDGQFYPTVNPEFVYNLAKTRWDSLPTEGAKTITSDTAPAGAKDGDQWLNTVSNVLYIWVVDVDGGQWIESVAPISANGYYSPNYIINGGFDIWQRGTSFTATGYTADRWNIVLGNITSPTITRNTNVGETGLPESIGYYASIGGTNDASTGYQYFTQPIEDVKTLAGQTITVSFYAKGSVAGTIGTRMQQGFGTGGSTAAWLTSSQGTIGSSHTITTSWQRYSVQYTVPSIIGKTISATDSYLGLGFVRVLGSSYTPASGFGVPTGFNYTGTLSITGIQVEQGVTATAFRRNANSIQGELAACQRYYYRTPNSGARARVATGSQTSSTSSSVATLYFPVTMRTQAVLDSWANVFWTDNDSFDANLTALTSSTVNYGNQASAFLLTGFPASGATWRPGSLGLVATTGYIAFSAEL